MDSRSNESGNDPMFKDTMQNRNTHFANSVIPRMCSASTSSTSSAVSQQSDSGISTTSNHSTHTLTNYERIKHCSFPNCDDVDAKYEKIAKIGHGTYGEVFKARIPSANKFVALKRILAENGKIPGFPITALREIRFLQQLNHENVINLIEVCRSRATASNRYRSNFYLVFDFCEHDLAGLLSNTGVRFSLAQIKSVMEQLLNAVFYVHKIKIMHRDLKPANILLTKNGVLKLADFGLSRTFNVTRDCHPDNEQTPPNRVVTLWYRPPELLLGETKYGPAIDMWGVGCIMAELWTRIPIMQGRTEQQQILIISNLCGSFTPTNWPGVEKLPFYSKIQLPRGEARKVKERLRPFVKDTNGLNLIDQLLQLNPWSRFDAETALNHDFFHHEPLPADLEKMFSKITRSLYDLHTRQKPETSKPQAMPNQSRKRPHDSGYVDHIY